MFPVGRRDCSLLLAFKRQHNYQLITEILLTFALIPDSIDGILLPDVGSTLRNSDLRNRRFWVRLLTFPMWTWRVFFVHACVSFLSRFRDAGDSE